MEKVFFSAVVLSAGSSRRMKGIDKQFLKINNMPVFIRSLLAFENSKQISEIILVAKKEDILLMEEEVAKYSLSKLRRIIPGGKDRFTSSKNGVNATSEDCDYVLIHDGARPFVSSELINRVCKEVVVYKAVIPGIKVKDTIKNVENNRVKLTYNREVLRAIQTPQAFFKKTYNNAVEYENKMGIGSISDDATLIENYNKEVFFIEGEEDNIKITTQKDLKLADIILNNNIKKREEMYRIGQGYDVHKFCRGRDLILGGIKIPYEKGLLGHSDADVLSHAVIDAILGALALGSIGTFFPDTDTKYKNADSQSLLFEIISLMKSNNYDLVNLDCTIIAQEPKINPFVEKIRGNLSALFNTDIERISIKATTEEGLGFTGRLEGIRVHVVCLLQKNN